MKQQYTKEFLLFFDKIKGNFSHRLYNKDTPAVGMLKVQNYYEHLLAGTFLDEFRITNTSIIKNYSNVERICSCTEDDIVLACNSFKPIEGDKKLTEYFLSHNNYSRIVEDILHPGFVASKEFLEHQYPTEMSVLKGLRELEEKEGKLYKNFIEEMNFPDAIQTKKKFLSLYLWWKPYKDIVFHFSVTNKNYQKTFKCFLDYYLHYFDSWDDRKMLYNVFGMTTGKVFDNFLDFCVKNGYHLKYDKHSWCLPWNRKIV